VVCCIATCVLLYNVLRRNVVRCAAMRCNAALPVFHAVSFACEAPDFRDIFAICIYCTAYPLFSVGFRLPDFGDFVAIFRHSSPYIKAWRGITAVVHIPGQVRADAAAHAVLDQEGTCNTRARAQRRNGLVVDQSITCLCVRACDCECASVRLRACVCYARIALARCALFAFGPNGRRSRIRSSRRSAMT
jgi:hypothetical protein